MADRVSLSMVSELACPGSSSCSRSTITSSLDGSAPGRLKFMGITASSLLSTATRRVGFGLGVEVGLSGSNLKKPH
jgi:hypothetical protein